MNPPKLRKCNICSNKEKEVFVESKNYRSHMKDHRYSNDGRNV